MASLLDLILSLQQQAGVPGMSGGLLGPIPSDWRPQDAPEPGPSLRYDPNGPGSMVDLRGGGSLMAPPGPQRVAIPQLGGGGPGVEQFPQLGGFGVTPGQFGVPGAFGSPSAPAPAPLPPAQNVGAPVVGRAPLPPDATQPPSPQYASAQRRVPSEPAYQPPPQQEPGFLDRIGAGFSNLLNNPSLPGLVQGAQGFATGRYTDPSSIAREYQMATYNNLRRAGYSHPDAAMAANNPVVLKQLIEQAYAPQKLQTAGPGERVFATGGTGLGGGGRGGGLGGNITQIAGGLTPEQMEEQKKSGQLLAESYDPIQKAGTAARAARPALARMKQLNEQAYSGPGAPAYQHARALLVSWGIPSTAVPAGEEFTALQNRMILDSQPNGALGAGVSNADLERVQSIVPGLANTVPGRTAMINYAEKINQRKIDILEQADRWKDAHDGSMKGFNTHIAQWAERPENQMFPATGPGTSAPGGDWTQVTPKIRVRPMQ